MKKIDLFLLVVLLFLTIKGLAHENYEACPDILKVPNNGSFYRCLSNGNR